MRMPYVVGRWVRGENHYGRERLIEHLLNAQDTVTWLVGTRRMGKTSLLRQLEYMMNESAGEYIPIFWDLQGCQDSKNMSEELYFAMEEAGARLAECGIEVLEYKDVDAIAILRDVSRWLSARNKRLFLLIDEAEVLIEIAAGEPTWLARLRKVLQAGRLRTVITSTKLLAQLNVVSQQWKTSPFLFGLNLANLWKLDDGACRALVKQAQLPTPLQVADETVEDILNHTNGHPYLIQYLCQRLFFADSSGKGCLRPVEDGDLETDHILAGFFLIDFQYLTRIERKLLLTVAELTVTSENDILKYLSDISPQRIQMFLYGLEKLGYLRQIYGNWAVGNEFLRRWVHHNGAELSQMSESYVDDDAHENILRKGQMNELAYLRHHIERLKRELAELQSERASADDKAGEGIEDAIKEIEDDLMNAQAEIDRIMQG